jgi:4-diphosphocytidyl-2-C-methyl-D-erythritol kinase
MILYPNAKINLGLYVTEKRNDGFHNIETIFYPVNITDILEINISENSKDIGFKITGNNLDISPEDNIVLKAYNIIKERYDISNVNIHLHKQIPSGAGLGGGSSDAAFTLIGLNKLFNLNITEDELCNMAAELGSDCPFFIMNKPVHATGRGEILTKYNINLSNKYIMVVKPDLFISTPKAYSLIKPKYPTNNIKETLKLNISEWKNKLTNDFEYTLNKNEHKDIFFIKDTLYKYGAEYALMSGSGSSVFGIFPDTPPIIEEFNNFFCQSTILK